MQSSFLLQRCIRLEDSSRLLLLSSTWSVAQIDLLGVWLEYNNWFEMFGSGASARFATLASLSPHSQGNAMH